MMEPIRTDYLSHAEVEERYPQRELLTGFEGGGMWQAAGEDEFVLITDESTMSEFVDDEDLALLTRGVTVRVFASDGDREAYARRRRWLPR